MSTRMSTRSKVTMHDQIKNRWVNPIYQEGVGRRTGRQMNITARVNDDGFENFSDYWSDQSVAESDISEITFNKENNRREKGAANIARKLSSPLKSMQSFTTSEGSSTRTSGFSTRSRPSTGVSTRSRPSSGLVSSTTRSLENQEDIEEESTTNEITDKDNESDTQPDKPPANNSTGNEDNVAANHDAAGAVGGDTEQEEEAGQDGTVSQDGTDDSQGGTEGGQDDTEGSQDDTVEERDDTKEDQDGADENQDGTGEEDQKCSKKGGRHRMDEGDTDMTETDGDHTKEVKKDNAVQDSTENKDTQDDTEEDQTTSEDDPDQDGTDEQDGTHSNMDQDGIASNANHDNTDDKIDQDGTGAAISTTPVQQTSLNEADITGSIMSIRTQEPNTALRTFRTKKRLSFSAMEQTAKKSKKQEVAQKPTRRSPRKSARKTSEDAEPEDAGAEGQEHGEVSEEELDETVTGTQEFDTPVKKSSSSEEEKASTVKKRPKSPAKSVLVKPDNKKAVAKHDHRGEKQSTAMSEEDDNDSVEESPKVAKPQRKKSERKAESDHEGEVEHTTKTRRGKVSRISHESITDSPKTFLSLHTSKHAHDSSDEKESNAEDNEFQIVDDPSPVTVGLKKSLRSNVRQSELIVQKDDDLEVKGKKTRKSKRQNNNAKTQSGPDGQKAKGEGSKKTRRGKTQSNDEEVESDIEDEETEKLEDDSQDEDGSPSSKNSSTKVFELVKLVERDESPPSASDEDEQKSVKPVQGRGRKRRSKVITAASPSKVRKSSAGDLGNKRRSKVTTDLSLSKVRKSSESDAGGKNKKGKAKGKGRKASAKMESQSRHSNAEITEEQDDGVSNSEKVKGKRKQRKASGTSDTPSQVGDKEIGDEYAIVEHDDGHDVSNSVVMHPLNSKRLSWEKSPSELSPINIGKYAFNDVQDEKKKRGKKSQAVKSKKTGKGKKRKGKDVKNEASSQNDLSEDGGGDAEYEEEIVKQDKSSSRRSSQSKGETSGPSESKIRKTKGSQSSENESGEQSERRRGRGRKQSKGTRNRSDKSKDSSNESGKKSSASRDPSSDSGKEISQRKGKKSESKSRRKSSYPKHEETEEELESKQSRNDSKNARKGQSKNVSDEIEVELSDVRDSSLRIHSRKSKGRSKSTNSEEDLVDERLHNSSSRKNARKSEGHLKSTDYEIEEGLAVERLQNSSNRKSAKKSKGHSKSSEDELEEGKPVLQNSSKKIKSPNRRSSKGSSRRSSNQHKEFEAADERSIGSAERRVSRTKGTGDEMENGSPDEDVSDVEGPDEIGYEREDETSDIDDGPKRTESGVKTPSYLQVPGPSSASPYQTPRSILRKPGKKSIRNRRLTLHFFEEPKRKGFIVKPRKSMTDGVRRSKRTRVPALEFWRNERPLYERRKSGFSLVGILSPPNKTPATKERKQHSKKKRVLSSQTPGNVSMHVSPPVKAEKVPHKAVTVINPETEEEVEIDAVITSKMHNYVGPSGKVAEPEDPITVCKCFSQRSFSTGILKVRPLKEKSTQLVKRNTMVFSVVTGKLAVTIHNTTQILQTGDSFFVPQGNTYNIRNLRRDEAKLTFTQLKSG